MELIYLWEADIEKAYVLQNAFLEDENGFINNAYGYSLDEYKAYVKTKAERSKGIGLPEGYVADTVYILIDDNDDYVGIFNLRHNLNEKLKNGAGHIGYGICAKYRGRGYATKGLKLLIAEAFKIIPEEEIYMSVNKNNLASLKVQLKNGAYIHHEDDTEFYTRIKRA